MAASCLLVVVCMRLHAATLSEAFVGEPFGVGRVTVGVLRGEAALPLSDERFTVVEAGGRVMYPVLKEETVRRLVRRVLEIEAPREVSIYYLFQGDQPFDISAYAPTEQGVHVKPRVDPGGHRRLFDQWWQQYSGRLIRLTGDPAYPPVVENFLTAMLARRTGQSIPEVRGGLFGLSKPRKTSLSELFVNERQQLRTDREMMTRMSAIADMQPLPAGPKWHSRTTGTNGLDELDDLEIESMAAHVPAECFYVRFGTFSNYWWFREFKKKWDGDLGNMLLRRAIRRGASQRTQQQLALVDSALAEVMGPQVIADAALIGLDPYVGQGAAIGVLLEAKNNFILSADLLQQRRQSLAKFADATETNIEISNHKVSLISTPDGRVRSYYVRDELFHLVATSPTLIRRFLEAGQGDRSLASLTSFRLARNQLPVDRQDTMFAHVPAKFFQELCSPHYRVEFGRRLRSSRESHLLEMARLTAAVERSDALSRENLIDADILPASFAARPDGSTLQESEVGLLDSMRGAPGFSLPIADMIVDGATSEELANYRQFVQKFQREVGQLPPITIAVRRDTHPDGDETMRVDLLATPLAGLNLGSAADMLGQPAVDELRAVEGDIVSVEAVLDLPIPLTGSESEPHHLFGALRDFRSPLVVRQGRVAPNADPTELIRGYVGAWPRPGLLELVLGSIRPDGNEPEPVDDRLWNAQQDDFLVISFKPAVIDQVVPQLAWEPAERAAQLRARIVDLTGTKVAESVNALGYMRSREASVSASRLMNSLANQLHVPRHECRKVAERLVDGKFVCALGGEYQLFAPDRGLEVWISSALPQANRFFLAELPADFQLPLLSWFRGMQGDLTLTNDSLSAHLEIGMSAAAVP